MLIVSNRIFIGLIALILLSPWTAARVKLVTLPERESVAIRLDHPTAVWVRETRIVPLVQGRNQVDFSWNRLALDAESLLFQTQPYKIASSPDEDFAPRTLAASYPPNENAVTWAVHAPRAGAARVDIGYLLSGLEPEYAYRAIATQDEKHLALTQYLRLNNRAGEDFGPAHLKTRAGEVGPLPLRRQETKQVLLAEYPQVPVEKQYTCGVQETGWLDRKQHKLRVPMHYRLRNRTDHGMGQAALPPGKTRIFQNDGHGGSAFLGEDWGAFTPVDDEMKLYLGLARDIVAKRTIEKNEAQRVAGNLFHVQVVVKYELENFKDQAATLNVVEHIPALRDELRGGNGRDVEWELGAETSFPTPPDAEQSDAYRLVFPTHLPPRGEDGRADQQVFRLHLTLRNEW